MVNFDSPTRETCIVRESRTNTPLQALNLMNDVAFVEAARKLGERMLTEASPGNGVERGVELVLARKPKPAESKILAAALARFRERFAKDPVAAKKLAEQGDSKPSAKLDAVELAAYTSLGSLLLNLDETLTKE